MRLCMSSQVPEEARGSSRAGVPGGCEPPTKSARNWTQDLYMSSPSLCQGAVSPAPMLYVRFLMNSVIYCTCYIETASQLEK